MDYYFDRPLVRNIYMKAYYAQHVRRGKKELAFESRVDNYKEIYDQLLDRRDCESYFFSEKEDLWFCDYDDLFETKYDEYKELQDQDDELADKYFEELSDLRCSLMKTLDDDDWEDFIQDIIGDDYDVYFYKVDPVYKENIDKSFEELKDYCVEHWTESCYAWELEEHGDFNDKTRFVEVFSFTELSRPIYIHWDLDFLFELAADHDENFDWLLNYIPEEGYEQFVLNSLFKDSIFTDLQREYDIDNTDNEFSEALCNRYYDETDGFFWNWLGEQLVQAYWDKVLLAYSDSFGEHPKDDSKLEW